MGEIDDFVKKALEHKETKESIYSELLNVGWKVDEIGKAFEGSEIEEGKKDVQKRTINIILIFGAILVGAGIFSFIASNWEEMAKAVKIFIILFFMIAAYFSGWTISEKKGYAKTGKALYLLGSIIYGAGIFLIAQMFHIRTTWPDGFILWMLGIMAMGFALEAQLILFLSIPLGLVAIFGYPFDIFESALFGYSRFIFTSALLLLLAAAVNFLAGVSIRKKMDAEFNEYY